MNTVFVIGIFLSFFLQFLLLAKKHKSTSDKILAVWMFVFGFHLFSYYIYSLGYWDVYPHLVGITHPFPLLHGPLLYLYIRFSLSTTQHFAWKDYVHFLPVALSYLYMIRFFFFYTAEEKMIVDQGEVNDFIVFMYLSLVAFIISGVGYSVYSYRLLGRHERLIDQNFAYRESIDLTWLKYLILGIGGIFVVAGFITMIREFAGVDFGFNADLIFYSLIVLFIFLLGFFGIRHQHIFVEGPIVDHAATEPKSGGEYKRSGLKEEDAIHYHRRLTELMKTGKPYLEPKLTLNALAAELDISANHLSQVINQYEEKNFFDFVNAYRVEEFKLRAADPANLNFSFLAIAFDSGFNSKSSFNLVFKKMTGSTPSSYIAGVKGNRGIG